MTDKFTEKLNEYTEKICLGEWIIDSTGVYKENGDKGRTYASHIAVLPTALYRNMDNGTEKVELSYYKINRWRTVIVDRQIIASRTAIVKLASEGIEVTSESARNLVVYLSDVITRSLTTIPYRPSRSVLGWVEDGFVPYSGDITFDGEDSFKHLFKAVTKRGALSEWVEFMRPLRTNRVFRLVMAASFASPLIELVSENPFVLHLWGGTGTGKTVTLMCAMSTWGDPTGGKLTRTMNMTANSMLSTAAFLNNLPFAGDELQTIKSRWDNYDNLIMCITEGIDRGRMKFDTVNETRSWKCSFLFTGEEPCIKAASGGGAKNRVIEVHLTDTLVEHGNKTVNFIRQHYGSAALPYLQELQRCDVVAMYQTAFSRIIESCDTTDKQAGAMALLLTADKIASNLFWKDEDELTVAQVKPYMFTNAEVDVAERAYSYIKDAISENAPNFQETARMIWGVIESNAVYINKSVLAKLLNSEGFSFDAVKGAWKDRGYVEVNNQGKLRHIKSLGGIKLGCVKLILEPTGAEPTEPTQNEYDENAPLFPELGAPVHDEDNPFESGAESKNDTVNGVKTNNLKHTKLPWEDDD